MRLLEARRDAIARDRLRAENAGRAAPVLMANALAASKRAELQGGAMRLSDALALLNEIVADLGVAQGVQTAGAGSLAMAECEVQWAVAEQRVDALRVAEIDAARIESELAAMVEAIERIEERLNTINDELQHGATSAKELEPGAADLDVLLQAAERSQVLVARSEEQRADEIEYKRAVDAADAATSDRLRVTAAFVADAAPRLAAELMADAPCPVCGSREHPAPAMRHATERVDRDQLDAAVERSRSADSDMQRLALRLEEHHRALGDRAATDVGVLREEHAANTAAVGVAQQATNALTGLREQIERNKCEADDLVGQREPLNAQAAKLSGALEAPRQDADRLRAELGDIDASAVACGHDLLAIGRGRAEELATRERELAGLASVVSHVDKQRDQTLLDSGFADIDAARAVEIGVQELLVIDESIERWDSEFDEVTVQMGVLSKVDLPETRPETDKLRAEAETLREQLHTATNRQSQLDLRLCDARDGVIASRKVFAEAASLRGEHSTAERVATMCSGRNTLNVALETWVLAGELERVTAAANEHLTRMTRGRYKLERSGDSDDRRRRGGLDLVVLDADTGRARVPATLSGGEQFQASLALALGLADVVSQGGSGSGKVFEALFVDEGFGSLDPQTLDMAIDALHELHAMGRMVGVITHVEAMKQQLPIGVEVVVRPNGIGSTLRQP